jgi:histone acetyltransferase (RNA polymerase elongator complex component)
LVYLEVHWIWNFNMMSKTLWIDGNNPDCIKIYPCLLLTNVKAQKPLFDFKENWHPLSDESYRTLLNNFLPYIPKYTHINKIQRWVNEEDVFLGPKKVIDRCGHDNISNCIWQRSIFRELNVNKLDYFENAEIVEWKQGNGIFIAIESKRKILAYSRFEIIGSQAVIRDLRVLGDMLNVGENNSSNERSFLHLGLSERMLTRIEVVCKELKLNKILFNVSPGAVGYLIKRGYQQNDKYLSKTV